MISLGMIVRDASATLEQCLESVAPHVDEIVIGLGGESTDNTEEIARKYTDKIIPIEWHDDFAEARNIVLQATTGDHFLWLDADDELVGGERMRPLIQANPEIDAFYWGYDYAQNEQGASICYLVRERLIRKSRQWRWVGPVHEVLAGPEEHSRMLVNDILVKHHPQIRSGTRNIDILRAQLEASEPNPEPRVLVYLGTENASRGNFGEALLHLQRYVALSGWDEEKYQAQHRIADIYRATGNLPRARQADFAAISIRPDWPDAYLGLAETAFFDKNYRETIEWTKAASTKKSPNTFLITNPRDYDFYPSVVLGNAYAQLGDFEMAVENYKRALDISADPGVYGNLRAVAEELEGHQLVDAFLKVWTHLAQNDEWLKARQIFDNVPKLIEHVPTIQEKRLFTDKSTAHVVHPQLMIDDYINNPHWQAMDDELLDSPEWRRHPRLEFARKVIRGASNLLDLGCSDGFMSIPLAEENKLSVLGIDLDPRCIAIAERRASERNLDAVYKTGDLQVWEKSSPEKFDVALLFEVIEHVVDPEVLLTQVEKSAKHIAITTPHLAWQSPAPGWDVQEFKGHLRIFDTSDIERMLGPRGRIQNLYRHGFGESGWIFADYFPGEQTNGHVTILAPGTPEPWSPLSFEKEGLGGSETAVIKLSEGFSRTGKQVTVFSRINGEGYYNGVRYRDQSRYVSGIRSDLFIAWRAPELIDDPVNASYKVLWMHDTEAGDRLTPDRASKFDRIVVLTEWHKNHMLQVYPFLKPSQLVVIPNGVDLSRFNGTDPIRDPKRVVYSSSPDRGLDTVLEHIWPQVVERVPEAELHIYYGWNTYDLFIPSFPWMGDYKNKIMSLISRSKNVIQHGRISQERLALEMRRSGVWLYPTEFTETYCITAVEAQLAGLIPITNELAALKETVKSGIIVTDEVPEERRMQRYIDATVDALREDFVRWPNLGTRDQIRKNAPAVTWDQVAERWTQMIPK